MITFKRILFLGFLVVAMAFPATAADLITATITITNAPVGNTNSITWNGVTHTFTNDVTASIQTLISETNSVDYTTTNLLAHFRLYPSSSGNVVSQSTGTNVTVRGRVDEVVAITVAGGWAGVTYATQTVSTPNIAVRVPITYATTANRASIASGLVEAVQYATNVFAYHWAALAQLAGLTNNNSFTGTNAFVDGGWNRASITNAALVSGTLGNLTNGFSTNMIFNSPTFTNGVNYGNALSSPGSTTDAEQFGTGATATGISSLAVGDTATASGQGSTALGQDSTASGDWTFAAGHAAGASGDYAVAVGEFSDASGEMAIAMGNSASAGHSNSVAIGTSVVTTAANQFLVGSAGHTVITKGVFSPQGTTTNQTFTGIQRIGVTGGPYGMLAISRLDNTSLAAGNNTIDVAGASYLKISGAGAAFNLNGVTNSVQNLTDGQLITLQNSESYTMTVANDSGSAPEATRIYTGTGGDITLTNNPKFIQLIYDAATTRWGVMTHSN